MEQKNPKYKDKENLVIFKNLVNLSLIQGTKHIKTQLRGYFLKLLKNDDTFWDKHKLHGTKQIKTLP